MSVVFGVELDRLENDDDVRFVVPCLACGVTRVFTADTFDGWVDRACASCGQFATADASAVMQVRMKLREIEIIKPRTHRNVDDHRTCSHVFDLKERDMVCRDCGVTVNWSVVQQCREQCEHAFSRQNRDDICCSVCGVEVSGKTLAATMRVYDSARMQLADECQRLKDECTQLLAENARLRRGRK